jgi:uncharacterized OsmC-like protein
MSTAVAKKTINGLDMKKLFESVDALRNMPNLGEFQFWLTNRWIDGPVNRSTIKNFYGLAQEDSSREKPFILDADEPPVLLGENSAPNPVEYLLTALASCVTTSLVFHAAAKGIELEEVESRVEGDIDVRGFLGIDDNVPKGYKNIRMTFKIKADAPEDQLEEICRIGHTFSPVFNTLTNGVNVDVRLEK